MYGYLLSRENSAKRGFFMIYTSITELIGGTPLFMPKNFIRELGLSATLLCKLEYLNPAGSIKDRAALSMIEDAESKGLLKKGAVIIDVGTTRVPDASRKSGFRLNGDVKFDEVSPLCSYITPVPGGVGPMTICSLMKNTLAAGKKEYYK